MPFDAKQLTGPANLNVKNNNNNVVWGIPLPFAKFRQHMISSMQSMLVHVTFASPNRTKSAKRHVTKISESRPKLRCLLSRC